MGQQMACVGMVGGQWEARARKLLGATSQGGPGMGAVGGSEWLLQPRADADREGAVRTGPCREGLCASWATEPLLQEAAPYSRQGDALPPLGLSVPLAALVSQGLGQA